MLVMFQVTKAFDKNRSSMARVGKGSSRLFGNTLLDLVLFCFVIGNNNMHVKKKSLINKKSGRELVPAYGLLNTMIGNPDDNEELALLGAKKRKRGSKHF